MKIAVLIARILLGLVFLVFGSNAFLHFIPTGPMPPGPAGQFLGALFASHYLYVIGFFQVVPAVLLLANRYVPLALTLLGPMIVNILFFAQIDPLYQSFYEGLFLVLAVVLTMAVGRLVKRRRR